MFKLDFLGIIFAILLIAGMVVYNPEKNPFLFTLILILLMIHLTNNSDF